MLQIVMLQIVLSLGAINALIPLIIILILIAAAAASTGRGSRLFEFLGITSLMETGAAGRATLAGKRPSSKTTGAFHEASNLTKKALMGEAADRKSLDELGFGFVTTSRLYYSGYTTPDKVAKMPTRTLIVISQMTPSDAQQVIEAAKYLQAQSPLNANLSLEEHGARLRLGSQTVDNLAHPDKPELKEFLDKVDYHGGPVTTVQQLARMNAEDLIPFTGLSWEQAEKGKRNARTEFKKHGQGLFGVIGGAVREHNLERDERTNVAYNAIVGMAGMSAQRVGLRPPTGMATMQEPLTRGKKTKRTINPYLAEAPVERELRPDADLKLMNERLEGAKTGRSFMDSGTFSESLKLGGKRKAVLTKQREQLKKGVELYEAKRDRLVALKDKLKNGNARMQSTLEDGISGLSKKEQGEVLSDINKRFATFRDEFDASSSNNERKQLIENFLNGGGGADGLRQILEKSVGKDASDRIMDGRNGINTQMAGLQGDYIRESRKIYRKLLNPSPTEGLKNIAATRELAIFSYPAASLAGKIRSAYRKRTGKTPTLEGLGLDADMIERLKKNNVNSVDKLLKYSPRDLIEMSRIQEDEVVSLKNQIISKANEMSDLKKLPISDQLAKDLAAAGYDTADKVAKMLPTELMKIGGISASDANLLISKAKFNTSIYTLSASSIISKTTADNLRTDSPDLHLSEATIDKLRNDLGVTTVRGVAEMNPLALAKLPGMNEARARRVIHDAQHLQASLPKVSLKELNISDRLAKELAEKHGYNTANLVAHIDPEYLMKIGGLSASEANRIIAEAKNITTLAIDSEGFGTINKVADLIRNNPEAFRSFTNSIDLHDAKEIIARAESKSDHREIYRELVDLQSRSDIVVLPPIGTSGASTSLGTQDITSPPLTILTAKKFVKEQEKKYGKKKKPNP